MMIDLVGLNSGLFDWWTLVHFISGFAVAFAFKQNKAAIWFLLVLFTVYEFLEINTSGGFGGQESGFNIAIDLLAAVSGYALQRGIRPVGC